MKDIKENCDQTFYKTRNRTLDRYKFFARKQQKHESLRKFWNIFTGLAAKCDFDGKLDHGRFHSKHAK